MLENLRALLEDNSYEKLETKFKEDVLGMINLGETHLDFALRTPERHWRQTISRLYYSAYILTRAVRLYCTGKYSTEVSDHRKVGEFPNDFPTKSTYAVKLNVLRDDRNLCDYDHTITQNDLAQGVEDWRTDIRNLQLEIVDYLRIKGLYDE